MDNTSDETLTNSRMDRTTASFILLAPPSQRATHPQVATGDNPWITDKKSSPAPVWGRHFLLLLVLFSFSACMDLGEPKCDSKLKCPGTMVCDTSTNKCMSAPDAGPDAGDASFGDTGDSGLDAAVDASSDSSFDDAQDGSYPSDGSQDASDDAGDANSDSGPDGGPDAGLDAGLDGGDAGDTGLLAPVITGIDGDGTDSGVVCPDSGPCTGTKAQHRFRAAWIVSGLRLDTVTSTELKGSKTYGPDAGLTFEDGGTAMQRKLLLPITLAAGMFTLTLSNAAGDATAETYILQGEQGVKGDQGSKGDQGDSIFTCDAGVCATSQQVKVNNALTSNSISTGSVTATGTISGNTVSGTTVTAGTAFNPPSTFTAANLTVSGSLTSANLNVTGIYLLPDCPEGYTLASSPAGVTLCKKGADEMVKVGSFWIDKYKAVIANSDYYTSGKCDLSGGGNPQVYGQNAVPDWNGLGFPFTGNWTTPLYACSKTGVKPSAYMTWFQAQESCALSGKELCTNEQWQAAAAGTYDTTGTETGTQCHIATTNTSARNTGLAGATPGGTDSCMSKWGAEDMIGNLWEWVAMWGQGGPDSSVSNPYYPQIKPGDYKGQGGEGFSDFSPDTSNGDGTWNLSGAAYGCSRDGSGCSWHASLPFAALRGGGWDLGPEAGVFALYLSYGPSLTNGNAGFRCCRGR